MFCPLCTWLFVSTCFNGNGPLQWRVSQRFKYAEKSYLNLKSGKLVARLGSDAAATLPPRQAIALSNPPKPVKDEEVFVWPWMGILTNVS
jgi:hypothetical protein